LRVPSDARPIPKLCSIAGLGVDLSVGEHNKEGKKPFVLTFGDNNRIIGFNPD
jgi:hypothetical protein